MSASFTKLPTNPRYAHIKAKVNSHNTVRAKPVPARAVAFATRKAIAEETLRQQNLAQRRRLANINAKMNSFNKVPMVSPTVTATSDSDGWSLHDASDSDSDSDSDAWSIGDASDVDEWPPLYSFSIE